MTYQLYSIQDRVANEFYAPRTYTNEAVAVREFSQHINANDKYNTMFTHSGDYNLYLVGEFEVDTGCVVPRNTPKFIVNGNAVKGVFDSNEEY